MFLAPEVVSDIPVVRSELAGYVFAALHVPGSRLLPATDVGTHRASYNGAPDRGEIVTTPTTDLMADYAANCGADDRSRNIDTALLRDLFLLDPASLPWRSGHRMY